MDQNFLFHLTSALIWLITFKKLSIISLPATSPTVKLEETEMMVKCCEIQQTVGWFVVVLWPVISRVWPVSLSQYDNYSSRPAPVTHHLTPSSLLSPPSLLLVGRTWREVCSSQARRYDVCMCNVLVLVMTWVWEVMLGHIPRWASLVITDLAYHHPHVLPQQDQQWPIVNINITRLHQDTRLFITSIRQ